MKLQLKRSAVSGQRSAVSGRDRGLRLVTNWELSTAHGGEVFVTGQLENSAGNRDMYTMKFDTAPVLLPPPNDNKGHRWTIEFPFAGQPNVGSDGPESIAFLLGVSDPNIVPPPTWFLYTGPGYDLILPTIIVVGSGVDAGTGENWKIIRYVQRWP
ncbi:MAG: hypothetical protein IT437_08165 [Phycisphaerales bacterium]|nr:hypothetical protein [Phycisphaerales bacterium]